MSQLTPLEQSMPTITLSEMQTTAVVADPPNWSIINNPFIKMYNTLDDANKLALQQALDQEAVQLLINLPNGTGRLIPAINETALLPYLWLRLTRQQQQTLVPDIRSLCKKTKSTQALKAMSAPDLELIFSSYNLGELALPWPEVQALIARFTANRQMHYVQHYFQHYQDIDNQPQFLAQWQQFLTPLTADERYWVITRLSLEQFNALFVHIDFLFDFLTDEQKVNIVRGIDSDYLKQYLGRHFKGDMRISDNLISFLQLFALTDRVTVALFFTPAQLYYFIPHAYRLDQILPVFAETDRLTLLLHLGQQLLATIYFDSESDISCRIADIFELLPENQRLLFLKQGIAKANLIPLNDYWPKVTRLVKLLPDEQVTDFFDYLGAETIGIFAKKTGIALTIASVPASKRLSYAKFTQQLFPELFNDSFELMLILNYLPATDHAAFFSLFSETDLHKLYQQAACYEESAPLGIYLEKITTNAVSLPEALRHPNQTSLSDFTPTPVSAIEPEDATEQAPLLATTDTDHISVTIAPALLPLAKLDKQLTLLAVTAGRSEHYKLLHQSLTALRRQLGIDMRNQPIDWDKDYTHCPLRITACETAYFIERLMQSTQLSTQLALIEEYRRKTTPLTTSKTLGNTLAVVSIAALCFALGSGIGFFIGSWAGPASVLTAYLGGMTGLLVASTLTGAALLGTAGTAGAYGYFFRSPLQTAQQAVVAQATIVAKMNAEPSAKL